MTLSTPNQLVSAHGAAGRGTTQQIVVKNDGTGPLANVKMTATQPTNWTITFDQRRRSRRSRPISRSPSPRRSRRAATR